ncbi:MAG: CsbD family protein, partial [Bradyrhizobium sp.]
GSIKDAAGQVSGDKELRLEGKMDKAKGEARQTAGDVKGAASRATD